ncbi:MAG TPA: zf-HC2 domain-containing protein [Thermoanaerobaculia bacterium]
MNAAVKMQSCPDPETLSAFIDQQLDPQSRLEVVTHLVECGDCRDMVVAANEYDMENEAQTGSEVVRGRFGKRWIGALAAAVAMVVPLFGLIAASRLEPGTRLESLRTYGRVLVGSFPVPIQERVIGKMQLLAEAAESLPHRKTPGRLSGEFSYKGFSAKRGGGSEEPLAEDYSDSEDYSDLEVLVAANRAAERAKDAPTEDNLHTLGVASILRGKRNEAVQQLEQVATKNPHSAAILIDLAAAYLARGGDRDLQHALVAATKAWTMERTPAAAWNRALALELLHRDHEAISAWQEYVKIDPHSDWTTEARARIVRLQSYQLY